MILYLWQTFTIVIVSYYIQNNNIVNIYYVKAEEVYISPVLLIPVRETFEKLDYKIEWIKNNPIVLVMKNQ